MYIGLVNIFDIFLPQLLTYPNAGDPLNPDAGGLMLRDKTKYEAKIRGQQIIIIIMFHGDNIFQIM